MFLGTQSVSMQWMHFRCSVSARVTGYDKADFVQTFRKGCEWIIGSWLRVVYRIGDWSEIWSPCLWNQVFRAFRKMLHRSSDTMQGQGVFIRALTHVACMSWLVEVLMACTVSLRNWETLKPDGGHNSTQRFFISIIHRSSEIVDEAPPSGHQSTHMPLRSIIRHSVESCWWDVLRMVHI